MSFCSWRNSEVYRDLFEPGIYVCKKCNHELFSAKAKFKHDTPWPAFQDTIQENSLIKEIESVPQTSSKAKCFKVKCGSCKAPLGHEFLGDGPRGKSRF